MTAVLRILTILGCTILLANYLVTPPVEAQSNRGEPDGYRKIVWPFLERYCIKYQVSRISEA